MHLTALSHKNDIEAAQKKLIALLSKGMNRGEKTIGHQGGRFQNTLYYHKKYNLWAAFFTSADAAIPRYWFGYGLGDPENLYNLTPICEINSPIEGIDRRIGGAFAQDESGRVYLVHSGKIGGGKKGIGPSAFWEMYSGEPINILYPPNNKNYEVAQIGRIDSKNFLGLLAEFVQQVKEIKQRQDIDTQQQNIHLQNQLKLCSTYSPEYQGKRAPYCLKSSVEANCYHGRVVDALRIKLAKYSPVNDKKRDLYIKSVSDKIDSLFEVKTDTLWQSIYSGIGQLIVNADASTRNRFLVIYAPKAGELENKLKQIGITIVPYIWNYEQVIFTAFDDLEKILARK